MLVIQSLNNKTIKQAAATAMPHLSACTTIFLTEKPSSIIVLRLSFLHVILRCAKTFMNLVDKDTFPLNILERDTFLVALEILGPKFANEI